MKRIAFVLVSIMLPLSFAGCGASEPEDHGAGVENLPDVTPIQGYEIHDEKGGSAEVYLYNFNGTDCYVYDGYKAGGISCDFD